MDSLVLIPDISGFTSFVNETEIEHSRHITAELLELIIDSDTLGLTVSEVEGDAVVFYKEGDVPPPEALLEQARRTFIHFHAHLRQYESRRICRCGACTTAHTLTLKFVAHRGPLTLIEVKQFRKPYGPGIILAHRLLKNEVEEREYVLLTDSFFAGGDPRRDDGLPAWARLVDGATTYPDLGEVGYKIVALAPLHADVPAPPPLPRFERTPNPLVREGHVARSVDDLFELIIDLDLRLRWNDGVDRLIYEKDRVNRVGTQHRCLVQGELIDFETVTADFGGDRVVYGERVEESPLVDSFALFWVLTEEGAGTRLRMEMHAHPKPFPRSLLTPLFRLGAARQMRHVFDQLKRVAEEG